MARQAQFERKTGRDYGGGDNKGGATSATSRAGRAAGSSGARTIKKKQRKSTLKTVLVKLLLVTLCSICLSALFTTITSTMLSGITLFGIRIVGNAEANLLVVVFVATFLISTTAIAVTVLKGESIEDGARRRRSQRTVQKKPGEKPKPVENAKKLAADALDKREKLDGAMKGIEDFKVSEEAAAEEAAQATNERVQEEIKKAAAEEKDEKPKPEEAETDGKPETGEPGEKLSPHAEKQKKYIMKFLGDALDKVNAA
ncbi:MAG: hypothetical protein CFH05_00586 [Alphaproteobacteria bacterium MarineAlpha3_Bin4]|nr:MAG: hypothetical protein CFH05_00586 [Alphaproteobacteria bacterium MarineAlpha3_Bin4]